MSAGLQLSSAVIGSSFANDSELRLPARPRAIPELMVLPYGATGLLVEGTRDTQVLNGRAARSFVPRLLQELDGRRTLEELLDSFAPYPRQAVYEALAMLFSRGLLEDGPPPEVAPGLAPLSAFCGRYVDVTRVNANRGEALARLARGRVALLGTGRAQAALRAALQGCGLGAVLEVPSLRSIDELDAATDLGVVLVDGDDAQAGAWLDAAWDKGLRVLHARVGRRAVEVGPLFMPGKSACPHCMRRLRGAQPDEPAEDLPFWAGVVALHAFHLVSGIGKPNLYNVCHAHERIDGERLYSEHPLARLPGCARCGLEGRGPDIAEPDGIIWLLHNAANGMPPRELLHPRDYQVHYAAANMMITQEAPQPYYGATRVALPPGEPLALSPAWDGAARPARTLTLPLLATLLQLAAGRTADGSRRIAPSAGGLGSAELFVVVRQLEGLEPGVYHYFAHEHVLERLRATSDAVLAGALGLPVAELPPVLLVGTAHLTKVRQKYNDFAFRFGHLDAGVTRAFLDDMLRAAGVPYRDLVDARDASIAEAISLPTVGTRNMVTFVWGVGQGEPDTGLAQVVAHQYVDLLAALSSRRTAPVRGPQPRAVAANALVAAGTMPSLQELMLARRSVRRYAPRALPLSIAQQVVDVTWGVDDALRRGGALPVRMALWLVLGAGRDDAQQGVYRWLPQQGRLQRVREQVSHADVLATMLQQALARAPAVLYITGDFEQAVNEHGARGYRELISRAGALAARATLASVALGLGACPWGGLSEDGWGPLLGIDRYADCPLFGVSLGYAA
ncbi:MAG: nitroreductase family protein [Pseudomonadota bacterium]